ncbi:MAG: hypothetical protein EU549_02915 [Promethearchaeota archaeon]|nr:MAG: hypothetical protein EU549_02915 [Candidatus Lokiarchaeota archaeon]
MGKKDTVQKIKDIFKDTYTTVSKKSFWRKNLPWPEKLIRKPTIRLENPLIGKKVPNFLKSRYIILTLLYGVMFFFFSGGMYFLIGTYREIPMGYTQGDPPSPIIYLNQLNDQFIIEGLISAIFIFLGLAGFLLLYMSSKNFYKPTSSYIYLAFGVVIIIFSFFLLEIAMYQKGIYLYDDQLYPDVFS